MRTYKVRNNEIGFHVNLRVRAIESVDFADKDEYTKFYEVYSLYDGGTIMYLAKGHEDEPNMYVIIYKNKKYSISSEVNMTDAIKHGLRFAIYNTF